MGHCLPQQQHYDTGDTPPLGSSAVSVAAAGCILGSRRGGRPGPWGHGMSLDRWDTVPVSPVAPEFLRESYGREEPHNTVLGAES